LRNRHETGPLSLSDSRGRKSEQFTDYLTPIQRQLTVYCRRALHCPDDAGDVLQSAVTNAFRDFDKYSEGTNFRAWIYRYVTLEILNRNRAFERGPVGLSDHDPPQVVVAETLCIDDFRVSSLLEDPELVLDHCDSLVAKCVNELTEQERKIFLLRAIGDFKYREISEILGIPMGTVMGLLARARNRLREQLLVYASQNRLIEKGDRA